MATAAFKGPVKDEESKVRGESKEKRISQKREVILQKGPTGELCMCVRAKSLQLCLTLCDPMDHIPPDSSVHGILQARILEWVGGLSRGPDIWQMVGQW